MSNNSLPISRNRFRPTIVQCLMVCTLVLALPTVYVLTQVDHKPREQTRLSSYDPPKTQELTPEVSMLVVDRSGLQRFLQSQCLPPARPRRTPTVFGSNIPVKYLLPKAPIPKETPILPDNLDDVPEIEFQRLPDQKLSVEKASDEIFQTITKINHINRTKRDCFVEALLDNRPDLNGLPFAMGDACRITGERRKQFAMAVGFVREGSVPAAWYGFWEDRDHTTLARIAAATQIMAPNFTKDRLELVKYLAGVSHVEATRALARLAIFSPEDGIHQAACKALKVRREKDYSEVLVKGLKYPLPAVARRASEAIAKLERTDLIPHLLNMLDDPDPRAPTVQEIDQKKIPVVRELVKINHRRSCLLCHPPSNSDSISDEIPTAEVPVPGDSAREEGYNRRGRDTDLDLLVRIDVTYLRQDFSQLKLMRDDGFCRFVRFDFLVRNRVLTEGEANEFKLKLKPADANGLSPYQRAAHAALRGLTGKAAAPTAKAWRKLLAERSSALAESQAKDQHQ